MESVYHIVTIGVSETSWAHVWRLRSAYLGMGYDIYSTPIYDSMLPRILNHLLCCLFCFVNPGEMYHNKESTQGGTLNSST
jgi:hypothetical protein